MRNKVIISFVVLLLLGGGGWFALDTILNEPSADIAVEPASECDSCSARHKAYAKAKKSWNKKGQAAVDWTELPDLLPNDQ